MTDELARLRLIAGVARGVSQVRNDPAAVASVLADALSAELADGAIVVLDRPDAVRRLVHRDPRARAAMHELLAGIDVAGLPGGGRAGISRPDAGGAAEWSEYARRCPPRAVLAAPLASPQGVVGAVVLVRDRRPGPFDDEDLGAVIACNEHAALALEHAIALRERIYSEQRLRAVFDASPLGIVVAGPDTVFRAVNRAYADMLGYEPQELIGRSYAVVTHPDDLEVNVRVTDRYFADEVATGYALEKRYVRKDGVTIWGRVTGRPFVDSTGARLLLAIVEDITSRRQLDQARRDSEHMLAAIRDCVTLIGADWRYRFVNGRAAAQLGHAPDEMIGRNVWALFPELQRSELASVMREVMAGQHAEPVRVEEYFPASDRWYENTVSRCDSGLLVVWRDVTERKRAELVLRQALRLRDEFITVTSHELRTPLAALVLHLDTLERLVERGAGTEPVLGRVHGAMRQAERLEALVEELLEGAGRRELELASFDVCDLVREVAERLGGAAARSGCALSLQLGPPAIGTWDRARLDRVLVNLVGNAIKYGPGAPIDLGVCATDAGVEIAVRDRGIGIPEGDRARIFGRFERAVPHSHYGGLGLGLYVAQQIVEAHGGTIDVQSAPGEGATFLVRLPRRSVTLGRSIA